MSCQPPVSYADPHDIAQLAEPLRSRVAQMIHDAPTRGLVLISGYRTPWQQWLLRHERAPGHECDANWPCTPATATPGNSKHQKRLAADLGGRDLRWAADNAARYGLARTVPSELWHFEAGGTPTAKITPWVPSSARPWWPIRPGATDQAIEALNGPDNAVSETQLRLIKLAAMWKAPEMNPGPVDGVAGPRFGRAVTAFKTRVRALQAAGHLDVWPNVDPIVGEKTIAMLRWWTP